MAVNVDLVIITGRTVEISERPTDEKIIWNLGHSVDNLSYIYYGKEVYWRLIMMANPKYTMAFDIEVGDIIRIPLPFDDVIEEIDLKIKNRDNE